jgi:GntR family transcriptional regulator/MocR family aminotransferase
LDTVAAPLPLRLERDRRTPLGVQLATQVRDLITAGTLGTGDRLPSSRALAADLGVSRAVAEQGYDQLLAEGWLETRQGSGTYVAASAHLAPVTGGTRVGVRAGASSTPSLVKFDSGSPWIDPRHAAGWRRAWRDVAAATPPAGYPDPRGLPELREALATQLARTRGLACSPDQILVTTGTTDGLRLLMDALPPGPVAVEDPGYRAAVRVVRLAGRDVADVPVGAAGIEVGAVPYGVRAVYVTPAHQHPLGMTMSASTRLALLDRARELDAVVVEDDYDSEFRYDVAPLPALATLDPDRVVYLGTASKSVTPGLRLGWLVASPGVVDEIVGLRLLTHDVASWPVQRAYLSMLRDGHVDRLVRSARRVYADRSARVLARLGRFGEVHTPAAGMYLTLQLPADRARAAADAAAAAGFGVPLLGTYARSVSRPGLLLGFGGCTDAELDAVLDVLESSLAESG